MYQRDDGIVEFDPDVCIGCKACLQACPYDAIYIDPESGTAAKCHFCAHRTDLGLEPACVVVCPEHAIVAGDLRASREPLWENHVIDARTREAWSRGYAFLGRLIHRGVREEDLPSLRSDPDLWAALPRRGADIDLDAAQAHHHQLFCTTVFAYEGVFVDPRALVGATAEDLWALLTPCGADIPTPPDHFGSELLALAMLCPLEEDEAAKRLLHHHLLRWIVPATTMLAIHGDPFFTAVVKLATRLVEHHVQAFEPTFQGSETTGASFVHPVEHHVQAFEPTFQRSETTGASFVCPQAWVLDEGACLDDLISGLLTPVVSGGLLTTRDLAAISQKHHLPMGFGPRRLVLNNLLRAASDFDQTGPLLGSLAEWFESLSGAYQGWYADRPGLSNAVEPWKTRASQTAGQLHHLQREIAHHMPQSLHPPA